MRPFLLAAVAALATAPAASAGLYYSGEPLAELPAQWRGFLLDYRMLRTLAARPAPGRPVGPARARYEEEAARLGRKARGGTLTGDEAADLGALYLRLGDTTRAVEVLRPAQRAHPTHFRLAANLGTAWQVQGDLAQAAAALQQAVRLAPGKWQRAEELQLKLVRLRSREAPGATALDDLFGVRYVGPSGQFEPGRLAEAGRKRLPSDGVAQLQLLALWLPGDGRLLWQLGELAGAHGDVATAAAVLEGCVVEFGLRDAELLAHRRAFRTAADTRGRTAPDARTEHEGGHAVAFRPRSSRPLARKLDQVPLPPVDPRGVNALPWAVISETSIDRQYRPTFASYLKELDGRQVQLVGYMQPFSDEQEPGAFLLIEYPVGCWYCEAPEVTGIVLVELPAGKTRALTRGAVRVTGRLTLNGTDPENFLYTIRGAKVVEGD
jgi:tetratricopeptide (TPR) repeat protein